ncbi:MAG: phosphatidate cytidylyltransferase [Dongiaceae bacterium]
MTLAGERLWGWWHAFDRPVTLWITLAAAAVLLLALPAIELLARLRGLPPALHRELRVRTLSWMVLLPLMIGPVLLGAFWTIAAVCVLSLWCYREYARATGLFREKAISLCIVLGILLLTFASLDHWYHFFMALTPLVTVLIAICTIPFDRPQGYIQRVALGMLGFLLLGSGLGHLGYMADDWSYRPIVLLLLLAVAANDVFAFIVGKSLGGPKLLPATSPNKSVSGALGALLLTTLLVTLLGGPVFAGTPMAGLPHRIGLGLIVAALGQLGDLTLSSIKRDVGIKDSGTIIPGHGGVLDRFNSLLLVAPAAFHYIGYFNGFGLDQPTRIITGS